MRNLLKRSREWVRVMTGVKQRDEELARSEEVLSELYASLAELRRSTQIRSAQNKALTEDNDRVIVGMQNVLLALRRGGEGRG
jgi:molybdopterin converting factor small subunit